MKSSKCSRVNIQFRKVNTQCSKVNMKCSKCNRPKGLTSKSSNNMFFGHNTFRRTNRLALFNRTVIENSAYKHT